MFEIESYLRLMVRWELRGKGGRAWKGMITKEIVEETQKRLKQEAEEGIIDPMESGFLSYLTLSELKEVVLGSLWGSCYAGVWPSQDIVKTEFKKLIAIRNKVAHFRPVTSWDETVVRRFGEDLARWTRSYRRLREIAMIWEFGSNPENDFRKKLDKVDLGDMPGLLQKAFGDESPDYGQLALIDHHAILRVKKVNGALNSETMRRVLSLHEQEISLIRVGESGAALEVAIPLSHGPAHVRKCFCELTECARADASVMSSEAVSLAYGIGTREGVLEWGSEFPEAFLLSK